METQTRKMAFVLVCMLLLSHSMRVVSIRHRRRELSKEIEEEVEEEESVMMRPWNEENGQNEDSAMRLNVTAFRVAANEATNEKTKKELLKLVDFYDVVSERERALRDKVDEMHDKRLNVLEKMKTLHRTVQADRRAELVGLRKSLNLPITNL